MMQVSDLIGASVTSSHKQRVCYAFEMKLDRQTDQNTRGVFKLLPMTAFSPLPIYAVQILPLTGLIIYWLLVLMYRAA
jgi:hypothetical protein